MSTPATIKTALQAAITKANNTTGANDTNVTDAVDSLIEGFGKGEEPSGTLTITKNGLHNVRAVAYADVNVPAAGLTPSGTTTITANGTFDVTNFASALVNVAGVNARVYTKTLSADATSSVTFLTDDWLKSIQSNPNAFVIIRLLNVPASTACVACVFSANFALGYTGTTKYSSVVIRQTASTAGTNLNSALNSTGKYNGHANLDTNGKLFAYGNATYPFKAGTYQIIAGILESL